MSNSRKSLKTLIILAHFLRTTNIRLGSILDPFLFNIRPKRDLPTDHTL